MEPDEGIRVKPVPADSEPPIDHDHVDVGMIDQRIHERHTHGTGADHQIISIQPGHRHEGHPPDPAETGQRRPDTRPAPSFPGRARVRPTSGMGG